MKKNQLQLLNAKTLDCKEMKQLKGGILITLYECTIGYECYTSLADCQAECPRLTACRRTNICR